ncbi:TonB-dependent receptor [Aquimarina sp. MMG016]|uniref:TonB-dependent receptor n=1 Tax=Aquimarina sp. MMG016 TaxID=2822690 RepID=UPI001B3A5599|nr:TonB-dependent receptor [Aquimarina sp. MMG016]MBQ4819991.1 TonB-dependent receptor [Aquimarina sp. MMG016]
MRTITLIAMLLISVVSFAQNTISGKVVDAFNQPVPGVTVALKGGEEKTITDFDGFFTLTVKKDYPFTIEASSVGFENTSEVITSATTEVTLILEEINFLDELVISASRAPERLFESPVSIERFGIKEIKNTASADFYGGLENLKGVDINTNSLTLKSINTRGFATFANTRFVQLTDGMDNTAPALNFVLGNLIGMSELDVQNIELLPGASSALYGANAFNGILFMNSKNPFDHQGISAYVKGGVTTQEIFDKNETNQFYDVGIRLAHAFSDKFAAKANLSILKGTDWIAADRQDLANPGATRENNVGYDGVNVYGDEVAQTLDRVGAQLTQSINPQTGQPFLTPAQASLLPETLVSRTGYDEVDLNNGDAESLKFDAALHYRPFANDFEIIYNGRIGRGTTVTQDANRTLLKNFSSQQHKLEVKNNNFFVRGYITATDAGDSYDIRFTGINLNRVWKSDNQWFTEYALAYLGAFGATGSEEAGHAAGRQLAETGRLIPGTTQFEQAFNSVISNPDITEGSKIKDKSQFRHADANYNFSHLTGDFADIQIGGSFREYKLNSFGTVFTDQDGPIKYSEYGVYTQVQKKLIDERLKITGSVRYDKSQLFDGNFSPRFSVSYTLGANRNRNVRASFQTGFRNPTTQDLYIGLDVGANALLGSAPDNLDRYVIQDPSGNIITGRDAYENSYSAQSVENGTFVKADIDIVKPEKITAYEVGYRAQFGSVILDGSVYYNQYKDFISNETVIVPGVGRVDGTAAEQTAAIDAATDIQRRKIFTASTNSDVDISSYGFIGGVTTNISGFDLGLNYVFTEQDFDQSEDPDFISSFNTPKHKVKASIGKNELFKNFGFNVSGRWNSEFLWESDFGTGDIPSFTVIDAQINYTIPVIKAKLKLGANNITGEEYFTAVGSGFIGSQYYVGLIFNNL